MNLEPLPCAKTMAHGKGTNLCRVQKLRHTAKFWPRHHSWAAKFFCRGPRFAHGKAFAVYPIYNTRQRPALPTPGCCVGFAVAAHGKKFAVCILPFAVCFGTWQTPGFPQ